MKWARGRLSLPRAALLGAAAVPVLLAPPGAAAGIPKDFDHFRTGFPLTGAHERVACESCHPQGLFEGTPKACASCHGGGAIRGATAKPVGHLPTSNACDDCHITERWGVTRFEHSGVQGACVSCHNGRIAAGKTATHVPSTNRCEDCHRTLAWSPARFDHAGVSGSCVSCHNGVRATGKPAGHPPSSNRCEDCHRPGSWAASGFDHAGVTGNCVSCHNGVRAPGKGPNHIASSNRCEDCHSPSGWSPARFDHAQVTGSCATCHDGTRATGKGGGHFLTAQDCSACHTARAWTPTTFRHTSALYPGDHAKNLTCQACHRSNTQAVSWTAAAYKPDCAGCHAQNFKVGPHKKVENPKLNYTVSELRDCTGSCHVYTDSTLRTIKKSRSGKHSLRRRGW